MMGQFLGRLRRNQNGAIIVEMAFIMPVLILLAFGGFELSRLALLHQKLDRAAMAAGDLVSQAKGLSAGDFPDIFNAIQRLMEPYDFNGRGIVIVTSVSVTGNNPPMINWQQAGGGMLTGSFSVIGAPGGPATLPAGFTMEDGESVIIAEVFYDFAPIMYPDIFSSGTLYHRMILRPRFEALTQLQ